MGRDSRTGKGGRKGGAPVKPRITVHADGRIGQPDIFQYKLEDGTLLNVPPRAGVPLRPYTLVIHDKEKYEALRSSGWVYSPEHRGSVTMLDARRTS